MIGGHIPLGTNIGVPRGGPNVDTHTHLASQGLDGQDLLVSVPSLSFFLFFSLTRRTHPQNWDCRSLLHGLSWEDKLQDKGQLKVCVCVWGGGCCSTRGHRVGPDKSFVACCVHVSRMRNGGHLTCLKLRQRQEQCCPAGVSATI